ncbi:hypothetical protein GO495_08760 [Chitinophaga oryziterrae]|uniref:RDD domain-containing protein n=1 Tax=Chitinophaga oryziterrae TaxID=1031224 RepID=A0A6N8J987_9BACT|nr:RDD family protein [Chitinophaga oryziterrae]MVT40672.1 hypothetical protein [Chitinophaga oryziterrae]
MTSVKIPTSFNIDLEFETANIGQRFLAWLIDVLIRGVFVLVMSVTLGKLHYSSTTMYVIYFFIYLLPFTFYFLALEILMNGQTPGKKMMGIRVRNMNGGKPSISQHLIRWLFRAIETPWIVFNAVIPIVSMVRSPYDQRLGDVVAGTIVVNTRSKTSINETIFRDMSEVDYTPQFPQILKLSDRDMNKIKELMDRAIKSGDVQLTARVSYRVRDVLNIQSDLDHLPFLETVLNDYNYYTTR